MAIKSPPGLIPLSHLSGEELWPTCALTGLPMKKDVICLLRVAVPHQKRRKRRCGVDAYPLARNAAIQRINYCNEAGEQADSTLPR